ncbi:hypothetical protein [Nostoc sp.]|uniref:hypothetical protein n=1 Tax=Nostoc sp. TaxID=1180 RepID=UPI002FF97DE7
MGTCTERSRSIGHWAQGKDLLLLLLCSPAPPYGVYTSRKNFIHQRFAVRYAGVTKLNCCNHGDAYGGH